MVNRMALPSGKRVCSCTNPFPKERRPTNVPRSQSCIAPETISAADADPSSIKIISFPCSKSPSWEVKYSVLGLDFPSVYTINFFPPMNSSEMEVAASKNPPGLPRKSKIKFRSPSFLRRCMAKINSSYVVALNREILMYPVCGVII